jgi:hypothetical protein
MLEPHKTEKKLLIGRKEICLLSRLNFVDTSRILSKDRTLRSHLKSNVFIEFKQPFRFPPFYLKINENHINFSIEKRV